MITKRSVRLELHKLLNLTNTWGTGIKVTADGMYLRGERDPNHGISLIIQAGFYTGLGVGWYLTSSGAAPTDSHLTSVREREPNGGRLGQLQRKAGWIGAISISLVWCIRYRRPDFHQVTVRQESSAYGHRARGYLRSRALNIMSAYVSTWMHGRKYTRLAS